MKALFVGQRVRITGCSNPRVAHHVGKEGVVTSGSPDFPGHWVVDDLKASNGKVIAWDPIRLEPILPEGSAPSEYSFSELMDSLRETVK